ncbi:AAA family ATPase [Photobacterium lutimaris]|uniref:Nitrogenase iron protein n=1 Tax=Photobacterium lutimaris TaxID=388278 RepID=A0A2T3J354_9GAMM|nr:nitrogenase iron protein NifH [Photobacterium lutimaris]PSU35715.1 nitrogenase iron protein [Photobacterium lutimaris]TDR78777.1 Mo-nitrogenase iron protein subunit NifH [Photobacterium lutimaris]
MLKLAIYGKGGIGKSTTSANLSVALAEMGYKVMQIGCDPKADSTKNLTGGVKIPSVLSITKDKRIHEISIEDVVHEGYKGVYCVEAGGPEPGIGCAGRGVISVLEFLTKLDVYNKLGIDIVLYDVLGDVVCGGFAVPLRAGYAELVYEVTSGEMMAMYAANNIAKGIKRFAERGGKVRLGGLICNERNAFLEKENVSMLADRLGSRVVKFVPRDNIVQESEMVGKTVLEFAPESAHADVYRQLARTILDNQICSIPTPMDDQAFESMLSAAR